MSCFHLKLQLMTIFSSNIVHINLWQDVLFMTLSRFGLCNLFFFKEGFFFFPLVHSEFRKNE